MPIDIDRLSEEELVDLNHRVVERLRFIRQAHAHHAMLQFRIGEVVAFEPDGRGRIEGVVIRYNKKSVTVLTPDGQQWRVSPGYLRKVESGVGQGAGNVVQLPKRWLSAALPDDVVSPPVQPPITADRDAATTGDRADGLQALRRAETPIGYECSLLRIRASQEEGS